MSLSGFCCSAPALYFNLTHFNLLKTSLGLHLNMAATDASAEQKELLVKKWRRGHIWFVIIPALAAGEKPFFVHSCWEVPLFYLQFCPREEWRWLPWGHPPPPVQVPLSLSFCLKNGHFPLLFSMKRCILAASTEGGNNKYLFKDTGL